MTVQLLLEQALERFNQKEVAARLGVTSRTIRRWQLGETEPPEYLVDAIRQRLLPLPANDGRQQGFKFIDLFAGIGGMRLAFEKIGGRCVFTSEWDEYAKRTYLENFQDGPDHHFAGDITAVKETDVPHHDVLLAGFPCQPFSIAGVSKKNALGRPHGFADKTQGTLFFDVARIIAAKRPAAFLLENVKNLVGHDKGRTFATIVDVLRDELRYHVSYQVINGRHFVPQHRERIIIVGFREESGFSFDALQLPALERAPRMASVLHREDGSELVDLRYLDKKGRVLPKYTLTDKLWLYLKNYAAKHRAAGNGFGFGMVSKADVARTLSARYYKDGSEILVSQGPRKNPRRLTPRECARLMGFPEEFRIPVSDTRAYKQFGNSVVVPVIEEVARIMEPHIDGLVQAQAEEATQRQMFAA